MIKKKSNQKKTFNNCADCGTIDRVYRFKLRKIKLLAGLFLVLLLSVLLCYTNDTGNEAELNGNAKDMLISVLQFKAYKGEISAYLEQKRLEEADREADASEDEPGEPVSEDVKELMDNAEKSEDSVNESTAVVKKAYLTFDDGPSPNTNKILDVLDDYGVKGNFFVIGRFADGYKEQYNRILREGHVMGMHSYSHIYNEIYESVDSFDAELNNIQFTIYDITGFTPEIYRFPGGSANEVSAIDMKEFTDVLDKRGIVYYDWNVNSGDADASRLSKEEIIHNVFDGINALDTPDDRNEVMILFHDLSEQTTTVEALPAVIEGLQAQGYVIAPIDDYTKLIQYPK